MKVNSGAVAWHARRWTCGRAVYSITAVCRLSAERWPTGGLRAPRNANRVRRVSAVWPSDGGPRVACVRASVARCLVASAADSCPRAVRADHAPGQRARRSRRRVSAGDLVSGTNPSIRGWLHGRRALVRRGLRPQPRLGVLEVSLDATREPFSHRHVFGRIVLGCPLSVAPVVCRQTALDRLGDAVLPAARAEALSERGRSRPYFFGMMPR